MIPAVTKGVSGRTFQSSPPITDDGEIDILTPAGSHEPEFVEWRWEPMRNLPDLVIPFKREVYQRVVDAFAHLVK